MRILDMDQVIEDVKSYLPQYLQKHGHEPNKQGRFRCPNHVAHSNGDENPSASFVPNTMDKVWNCFACGERGTIFHAAQFIGDHSIGGQGFVETLSHLADEFVIRVERDLQAEEITDANEKAVDILKRGRIANKTQNYIAQRFWTNVAEQFEFGYGTHDKFQAALQKYLTDDQIADSGLNNRKLFHDRLVWPIRDENNHVVGFASRKLDDFDDRPKYINSPTNRVYQKSRTLYNMNAMTGAEVWVVEGYADVWTMTVYGIPAVACMGTAFTNGHLELLVTRGIKRATFCFDGDVAGQEAARRVMPILENQMDIACEVVFLPAADDEKDPDGYIKKHGVDAFLELPRKALETPAKRELGLFLQSIDTFDENCWNETMMGYRLDAWPHLTAQMNGFQKGLYLVGGLSNIGKTHFMLTWMKELAKDNPHVCVLFFSIDDNKQKVIARFIAAEAALTINTVADPINLIMKRFEKSPDTASAILAQRDVAMQQLKAMRNLHVKDDVDGNSLEFIEKKIALFREITGMPLAVYIDNFHKIRVPRKFSGATEKFTYLSEEVKRITNQYELMTGMTVELRKLNHSGRPDIDDIKDSGDIVYDADVIFMLHNDMHSKDGRTSLKFQERGVVYPFLEVAVKKNKLSSFKGRDWFQLYPEYALVKECASNERDECERLLRQEAE